jgi:hypothetical protein
MARALEVTEDSVVQQIRAEAARGGLSVAEYLHEKIRSSPRKLTNDELLTMMAALPPLDIESSAGIIRELRGPLPDPSEGCNGQPGHLVLL